MIRLLVVQGISMEVSFSVHPEIQETENIPQNPFTLEIHYIRAVRNTDLLKVVQEFSSEAEMLLAVNKHLRQMLLQPEIL